MKSALSLLVKEQRFFVVENFNLNEVKTTGLAKVLGTLGVNRAVLVDSRDNENLRLSARNLADHLFLPPEGLNVYDLLKHDQLVISKDAALQVQAAILAASGKGEAR